MKKLLLFLVVAFVSIVSLNGANVTLTTNSSTMGGTSSKSATFQTSIGEFTVSMTSVGSHQTDHIRCAKSATFTLTAPENVLMSKVVFNCTGASNNGFPATSNYTKSGAVGTWENSKGENEISLKASDAQTRIKSIEITTIDGGVSTVLGDITVYYGADATPVVNGADLKGIIEGTLFTFSADKAESIVVTNSENTTIAEGFATAEWTATVTEGEELTVTAKLGDAQKTFSFMVEVVEAPKPELGNLIVTYGDGIQVNEDDEISVEIGTTFTFSAENASNIKVESFEDLVVVNENANSATWTPESAFEQDGFTVTATDGTDSKTLTFLLTVTEPYVEPINPDAEYVYTLVTTGDDIKAGNEYLIAASVSDRVMAAQANNNRTSVEVEIVDNEIWTLPTDAQVVKLSESTNVAGSYDIQVGETSDGTPQYLYAAGNANANKNQNYLKTTTGTSDSSAAAISIDADNVVKIDFTKASGKQGRYMQYNGVGQSTVFACYTSQHSESGYEHMRLFKKVELPGVPVYDNYADDDTKVAIKIIKGQLHVTVTEYDSEGKEVVPVSTQNKASYASTSDWTNPVTVDENGMYLIELPKISGNYIKIQAKNELNGYHSEELVKNVDASGNVISGVEGVVADDENAPVEYFNLQGMRVAADQPGIYIRRQGSKVEKVSIAR